MKQEKKTVKTLEESVKPPRAVLTLEIEELEQRVAPVSLPLVNRTAGWGC